MRVSKGRRCGEPERSKEELMSSSISRYFPSKRAWSVIGTGALSLILSACGQPSAFDDREAGGAAPAAGTPAKKDIDVSALSQLMLTFPTDAPIWASHGSKNGRVELCLAADATLAQQKGTEISPTYSILIANGDFPPGTRLEWRYSGCGDCVIEEAHWIVVPNNSFGRYSVRSFEPDGRQGAFQGSIDVVPKPRSECQTILASNGARNGKVVELCSSRDQTEGQRKGVTVSPTSTVLTVNGDFDFDTRFEWRYAGCGDCVIEPSAREIPVRNTDLGTFSVRSVNPDGSYGAFADTVTVTSKACKPIIVSGGSVGNTVEMWTAGDYVMCKEAGIDVKPTATQISVDTSFFPEGTRFEWRYSGCYDRVVARGTAPLAVDKLSYGTFSVRSVSPGGGFGTFSDSITVKPKASPPCTLPPPGLTAPQLYVDSEYYSCGTGYEHHGCSGLYYLYDVANGGSYGPSVRFQRLDTRTGEIVDLSQTRTYASWRGWGARYRLRAVDDATGLTSAWISAPKKPEQEYEYEYDSEFGCEW